MLKIQNYLKEHDISLYKLAKDADVPYPTIFNIVNGKTNIMNCTYRVVLKISSALDISPEKLVDMCEQNYHFYVFRSEQIHQVNRKGALQYLIEALENDIVRDLWNNCQKPEAFYVLATVDYISRKYNLPKCNNYNDIRNYKLADILYTIDLEIESAIKKNNSAKQKMLKTCIPEYLNFNIAEEDYL